MLSDQCGDIHQQLITGRVTERVVELLEAHHVDVRNHKDAPGPTAPVELAIKITEAGGPGSRARQLIGFGHRQFSRQDLTIRECAQPLAGGLLSVLRRCTAILRGEFPVLCGEHAVLRSAFALLGRAHQDLNPKVTAARGRIAGGLSLGHHQVPGGGGTVPGKRGEVPRLGNRIALAGGVQPYPGAALTLLGRVLTDLTRDLMIARINTGSEIPIARRLVAVGSDLIAIGGRLIAVRARLISVGKGLIAIGGRLVAVAQLSLTELTRNAGVDVELGRRIGSKLSLGLLGGSARISVEP
jgi:hypothetical protein